MNKWFFTTLLLAWAVVGLSQSETDLMRFSMQRQSGSARVAAIGGAFGALGADIGGLTINPAGLATFRKNTLATSLQWANQTSEGTYLGNPQNDADSRLQFSSLGFVYAQPLQSGNGWLQLNYGFSMNRTANFFQSAKYEGINTNSSLVDYFLSEANAGDAFFPEDYPFSAALAESVGLIYPSIPGNRESLYFGIVPNAGVTQSERINQNGQLTDYGFSVAGNFKNKLYVGGGVSLLSASFSSRDVFVERDHADSIFDFKDFTYTRDVLTEGDGLKGRLGVVIQPVNWLRLGLGHETGTRFTMSDDFRTSLEANFDSVPTFASARSPLFSPFTFSHRSAGKTIYSLAILFEAKGLISFDYEQVHFNRMRVTPLRSDQASIPWANELNDGVGRLFQTAENYRVGAEYVAGPLVFRAGYAVWGSPFRQVVETAGGDWVQRDVTAGIGLRLKSTTLDFALVNARWKNYRYPYAVNGVATDGVLFSQNRWNVVVGAQFRLD